MDRAAKLAAEARVFLQFEQEMTHKLDSATCRAITRDSLIKLAGNYGFSDLEISAAVDEALTQAGTTP